MTDYQYKHLKSEPDSPQAFCGVTIVPRMIPEVAGVCPVCHENYIAALIEAHNLDLSRMNRIIATMGMFGHYIEGYTEGLSDADDYSPKVEKVMREYELSFAQAVKVATEGEQTS